MDLLILAVAFVLIVAGAELFTNGVEWLGYKLDLGEGAVGSVLAAVGTAMPETMIPVIAILFATGGASDSIGVGAILGAPFMLSTLALFVTGLVVLMVARTRPAGDAMSVDVRSIERDMSYFTIAYAVAIGAAFLPSAIEQVKWAVAVTLVGMYVWYVKGHLEAESTVAAESLAPLRLRRLDPRGYSSNPGPRTRIVATQVLIALAAIVLGSFAFVEAVERVASGPGIDTTLLALVIAPIATELPEGANSVIWVRQGKDTLAMGNITGAMVFQSMIPTAIALLFAPAVWSIGGSGLAFASAGIAFLAVGSIFVPMARRRSLRGRHLLIGGAFYLLYLGLVVGQLASG